MADVLLIGGARFVGRHTASAALDAGHDVTLATRGTHPIPFRTGDEVGHVQCDRRDDAQLREAAAVVDPDVVVDLVAYHPRDVDVATDVFADCTYVYVSSGAVYDTQQVPKREGETPLAPCDERQATDDGAETYGNRKAEGDRIVAAAAAEGVRAMSVRPTIVYGPHDYTERLDYWLHRVDTYSEVLVPGDGGSLNHLTYVEDVADAVLTVAESGQAGEAYNVADRHAPSLGEWIELLAEACDTQVRPVYAGERELSPDLSPDDFPLYTDRPHLLATEKLAALGWESTPQERALQATVADHRDSDRDGTDRGPRRDVEADVLDRLG